MNKRMIYLLIGAGIVGLFYFGDQVYRNFVEAPTTAREKQLSKIEKAIDQADQLIGERLSVQKQLDAYEKMSLPFDSDVARTHYQDWLLDLVKSVGFKNTSVDAAEPRTISIKRQKPKRNQSRRKVVLRRYSYSLRCRGSLQQLVSFLFRFYRSGHLHKIRSINLNPSGGGSTLDTVFGIEALTLTRTERESELTQVGVNRLKQKDEQFYASISQRNIFSKTGSSILNDVRVSGITYGKSGKPQVWLKTGKNQPTMVFQNDDALELESHRVEVLDIQSERVLFLVDGSPRQVEIGKSLSGEVESTMRTSKSENPQSAVDSKTIIPKR